MRRSLMACFMVVLSVNLSSQQEPRIAEIVGKIKVANIQDSLKGLQANESGLLRERD